MAFAASLAKIVSTKKQEVVGREKIARVWLDHEAKLVDQVADLFRHRCEQEAEKRGRTSLTASFEVLSREVKGFPTHAVKDGTYIVSSWGDDMTGEAWYYATNGVHSNWSAGTPVLFAEMLESMVPKVLQRLNKLGFQKCYREAGTWKISVKWKEPGPAEDLTDGEGLFADDLTQLCARYRAQEQARKALASLWVNYEAKLLDEAVELFKHRASREAEQQRLTATVSFEVLSREIPDFPKRVNKDNNYYVSSWGGGGVSDEIWFYATHGSHERYVEGTPILFAEVLEGMMPKFLERLSGLGFTTCQREAGTWKVRVSWPDPDDEPAKKKQRNNINGH